MTIDRWAVIVPQEDAESVRRVEKIAREEGLTQVRVTNMLYMEFNKIVEPPEPIVWWIAKPLPFKVRAKIPCDILNKDTNAHRALTDGRLMDVWDRLSTFLPDEWGLNVHPKPGDDGPSLWVRPQDCEPL